jgi:hypothetical protein
MHRARVRDQRFVAGIGCRALEKWVCIGVPAGGRIACADNDFLRAGVLQGIKKIAAGVELLTLVSDAYQRINKETASKSTWCFLK